jgi:hypothetical protein
LEHHQLWATLKGYGWRVTGPLGDVVNLVGMRTIGDFPQSDRRNGTCRLAGSQNPQSRGTISSSPVIDRTARLQELLATVRPLQYNDHQNRARVGILR